MRKSKKLFFKKKTFFRLCIGTWLRTEKGNNNAYLQIFSWSYSQNHEMFGMNNTPLTPSIERKRPKRIATN